MRHARNFLAGFFGAAAVFWILCLLAWPWNGMSW